MGGALGTMDRVGVGGGIDWEAGRGGAWEWMSGKVIGPEGSWSDDGGGWESTKAAAAAAA